MNTSFIEQVPLFAALPPEEIHQLSEVLRHCEFPPDTVIFWEGEPGDRLSIILEGTLDIVKSLNAPGERILATLGAGEFIGEMSLLYRDKLRSASARTRTPVRLVELTQEDFDALLNRQPSLAFRIMQEMSLRLRNSEDATVRDLLEKNRELAQAYQDLQAAQAQLIEKEKMEHELRVARKIQERILPKEIPVIPGWQLAAYWQPARAVSGDFYDFIPFPEGKLGLVVGDVTDKGVPAALVMATTRSILRAVVEYMATPSQILARANDLLCPDMPPNMFVTCFFAVLDPATGRLRYANAGHDVPYQRTTNGVIELRATGMPLGLMEGMTYEEKETLLAPGDSVVLYSDGLVEAHNPQHEMFGFPRLRDLLADRPGEPRPECAALIQFLLDQLAEFTGPDWEQEDDVTFVTLERLG